LEVGYHKGVGGDVSTAFGADDGWLVKFSATGVVDWKRAFGGSANDFLYDIEATIGGYLIVGEADSEDGNINLAHSNDAWLLKVDNTGVLQWQQFLNNGAHTIFDLHSLVVSTDGLSTQEGLSVMLALAIHTLFLNTTRLALFNGLTMLRSQNSG